MAEWTIEPISRRHDRSKFFCGKDTLDKWLKESVTKSEQKGFARTYVAVRPGEVVVRGYYSISTCSVVTQTLPLPHSKNLELRLGLPAIMLGRLAVDVGVQKQGLGTLLLAQAMRRAQDVSSTCGCALLILDTRNGEIEAQRFYENNGFIKFLEPETRYFIPIKTIIDMKLRPITEIQAIDE